jgi:eukaryotic-like serine/threonine-protein kinase
VSAPGPTIAERYELGELLGRGGMSEVRAGRDLRLGRDVAIKLLTTVATDRSRSRERFEAEARAVASLSHPNVVLVFDSGEHEGVPFLVMERLPGRTLADELSAGPLTPERAGRVATDVLAALDAAHAAGIIHRDIKPSNVLLCPDGGVKVSDFGIAKTASAMTLTDHGTLLGTPGYLAPERLAGEPATPRSDLYSVGVLLYEALSGHPPFDGDTPADLMRALAESRPVPLLERRPDLPPHLGRAVERAMEKEPSARFATAADMAAALVHDAPHSAATAVLVPPDPPSEGAEAPGVAKAPPSRGRATQRRVVAGGVCLLLVVAVLSVIVARSGDRPDAASPAIAGPAQPFPAAAGPLAAGRYRTKALQPPVELTIDNGWTLAEADAPDVLFLKRAGQDQADAELTVLSVQRVFLRERTHRNAADYLAPGAAEPTPPDLLDWLQRHPRLRVSKPTDTRIGAVQAVRVDIEAASPYPSEVCVGPCVVLFQLDAEQGRYRLVKLDQGKTMRLSIARVNGRTVVVSVVAPADAMGAASAAAESVVKTMTFPP